MPFNVQKLQHHSNKTMRANRNYRPDERNLFVEQSYTSKQNVYQIQFRCKDRRFNSKTFPFPQL